MTLTNSGLYYSNLSTPQYCRRTGPYCIHLGIPSRKSIKQVQKTTSSDSAPPVHHPNQLTGSIRLGI